MRRHVEARCRFTMPTTIRWARHEPTAQSMKDRGANVKKYADVDGREANTLSTERGGIEPNLGAGLGIGRANGVTPALDESRGERYPEYDTCYVAGDARRLLLEMKTHRQMSDLNDRPQYDQQARQDMGNSFPRRSGFSEHGKPPEDGRKDECGRQRKKKTANVHYSDTCDNGQQAGQLPIVATSDTERQQSQDDPKADLKRQTQFVYGQ